MANMLISLDDSGSENTQKTDNFEVYRDLSMVSERVVGSERQPGVRYFVSKNVNVKAVMDSLHNIFSWILGERILNPEFGSKLQYYLYEGITDQNVELIMAEIRGLCVRWEPRVNIISVVNVSDPNDTENNTVQLDIKFTIPGLSEEQYNYSYIYDRVN
jgi:Phage baseplate assembly protein W